MPRSAWTIDLADFVHLGEPARREHRHARRCRPSVTVSTVTVDHTGAGGLGLEPGDWRPELEIAPIAPAPASSHRLQAHPCRGRRIDRFAAFSFATRSSEGFALPRRWRRRPMLLARRVDLAAAAAARWPGGRLGCRLAGFARRVPQVRQQIGRTVLNACELIAHVLRIQPAFSLGLHGADEPPHLFGQRHELLLDGVGGRGAVLGGARLLWIEGLRDSRSCASRSWAPCGSPCSSAHANTSPSGPVRAIGRRHAEILYTDPGGKSLMKPIRIRYCKV